MKASITIIMMLRDHFDGLLVRRRTSGILVGRRQSLTGGEVPIPTRDKY